jgi:hypothetical protein
VGSSVLQELQRGDPRVIGPYQLVGQLGSGGMGRVFLGRSMGGRLVAVKVIRSDLAADPDFRTRFRREVAAARRVSGIYTATVVDADADAEEPWLATAYVAGPSLVEAVQDHGPLPPRSVLALAAGLAESLVAIHKVGVVHRDLKPSNVLLAEDGPRLIDFGISRAAESTSVTRAGFVIGSPGFMSPEQAQGTEVGPPSDIFSLGAVLVFAATGEPPFGSGTTAALVFRVVFAQPQLDTVPDEIRPLVERCLAKDPGERPTAGELLAEIGAMQPEAGWLPGPVINAFPGSQARAVTAPPPPATPPAPQAAGVAEVAGAAGVAEVAGAAGVAEVAGVAGAAGVAEVAGVAGAAATGSPSAAPPDTSPTVTGFAPFIAAEPDVVTPEPVVATPGPVPPGPGTVPPGPATVPPVSGTVTPGAGTVIPEPDTDPTRVRSVPGAGPGPEPATGPELVRDPGSGPGAAGAPLPWGEIQGPRRTRSRRPVVIGAVAAAVILIASGATALALSGPSHPSAASTTTPPTVAVSTSVATSFGAPLPTAHPTAAPTSHRPTARPSRHPTTQPAAQPTQAHTTAPAPAPSTSSPAPRPKPTTPKPTHAPTAITFSASGASEASCGDVGAVQSSAGASVQFNFVNNSSSTVVIDEISSSGGLVNDATLSHGQQFPTPTYVGVYFVVEKSGGCLAVFRVTGSGQVTIN